MLKMRNKSNGLMFSAGPIKKQSYEASELKNLDSLFLNFTIVLCDGELKGNRKLRKKLNCLYWLHPSCCFFIFFCFPRGDFKEGKTYIKEWKKITYNTQT